MAVSPLISKVLKSTCRKLWCLSTYKKSTSSLTYFLRYCKNIANLLFWELWECLTIPVKIITSICSKLSCLSARKKSTSSLTSLLRYCKQIPNLLLWVIWAYLVTHIPNLIVSIRRNLICRKKINFILHIFLEILQRYCSFVILGTLHTQKDNINL